MKYILRTEIMYRRVRSVLDRSPAYLAALDDLQRITAAYKASNAALDRGARIYMAWNTDAIDVYSLIITLTALRR